MHIFKLLVTWFSLVLCYLVPVRPKYISQHPFLEKLLPMFLLSVREKVSHPYKTQAKL